MTQTTPLRVRVLEADPDIPILIQAKAKYGKLQ